ncbi:hypothetical protein [Zavarzinia compransoris]|uniref:Uncharacterized protein n=1 Tax=Zavarzinia compransoris TaxID=1264899 RepID=A0A317DZM7_9PROT|nr:hypothetical protein [Zavarzinia compransoris]PWR19674.1 hypothetical protein DKG75_14490 [Zavarzinia compransoris]TDP43382.1 hypothetical protein DES42_11283 [Zavarzinia compransoris]
MPAIPALELPEFEKRRLGLTAPRSWVILAELNEEAWPHGLQHVRDAREGEAFLHGRISPGFLRQILRGLLAVRPRIISRK